MTLSMDRNNFALYVHELRNQCIFAETAIGLFNQSIEKQSKMGAFFALQSFLTAASQVARLLWPNRVKGKRRAETLRAALGIPANYPLNDERLLNFWEWSDEKTDNWIQSSKNQIIAFDYFGPAVELKPVPPKDEHIYRAYDPTTRLFHYRGEVYNIQLIVSRIAEIAARINQAHDQLFPKPQQEAKAGEAGDAAAGQAPAGAEANDAAAAPAEAPANDAPAAEEATQNA